MRRAASLYLVLTFLLVGCTKDDPEVIDSTRTTKITSTVKPPPPYKPVPAVNVPGLAPDAAVPRNAREAECPYIDTVTAESLEGNRIYRTIVFNTKPAGCRFYFYCCDYHATLDIAVTTFPDALSARNAMIRTGGAQAQGVPGLIRGVDAVLYRTKFYSEDNGQDWACTFAKGKLMVTVRTNQTTSSLNARNIAEKVAAKVA